MATRASISSTLRPVRSINSSRSPKARSRSRCRSASSRFCGDTPLINATCRVSGSSRRASPTVPSTSYRIGMAVTLGGSSSRASQSSSTAATTTGTPGQRSRPQRARNPSGEGPKATMASSVTPAYFARNASRTRRSTSAPWYRSMSTYSLWMLTRGPHAETSGARTPLAIWSVLVGRIGWSGSRIRIGLRGLPVPPQRQRGRADRAPAEAGEPTGRDGRRSVSKPGVPRCRHDAAHAPSIVVAAERPIEPRACLRGSLLYPCRSSRSPGSPQCSRPRQPANPPELCLICSGRDSRTAARIRAICPSADGRWGRVVDTHSVPVKTSSD